MCVCVYGCIHISVTEIALLQVRLVDGRWSEEGRVEVCVRGYWTTVCDGMWDYREAVVVCNQLGFPSGGKDSINIERVMMPVNPVRCNSSRRIYIWFWTGSSTVDKFPV